MKKLSLLTLTAAVILGMMSCDKLKGPYIIEPVVAQSDTIALEAADTINFDEKIVVLLEDYTGVKCNNCPAAGALALELQEEHEGHLIVLGVHPKTGLQNPAGGFPDFRTDDGHEWNTFFNIGAYPKGLVNRAKGVQDPSTWATSVSDIINANAPVRLIVKTEFDDTTRMLKLSVHSKFLQAVASDDVRLTVCMMEDNILGKQVTPTGIDTNYIHRHVFRGTADKQTWGSTLKSSEISAGENFITNMKFTVSDEYNADEFYIVAFISDNNTKEVLMAAEKKIK